MLMKIFIINESTKLYSIMLRNIGISILKYLNGKKDKCLILVDNWSLIFNFLQYDLNI